MDQKNMLSQYLERIGLEAFPDMDIAGLDRLKRAHTQAIAFENLDIHLSRTIRVDSESVFDKLVRRRRGGYCFEQNRLFSDVLTALGVSHRLVLGRGLLKLRPGEIAPRNHLCLLVQVDGEPWLLDAGFGALYIAPVPLVDGATTASGHRLRRVGEMGSLSGEWLLEFNSSMLTGSPSAEGDLMQQYCFDLSEVAPDDIEQANHWTSTRHGTLFTSRYIVSISFKDGFASLADRVLTLRSRDGKDARVLEDAATYGQCLRDIFKLNVCDAEVANLPLFRSD
jgi:N-hydroxyarylamine O-acetyltransferase